MENKYSLVFLFYVFLLVTYFKMRATFFFFIFFTPHSSIINFTGESDRENILLKYYPGSPWILANDSRTNDQVTLTELHPKEYKELNKNIMRQRKQTGINSQQVEVCCVEK